MTGLAHRLERALVAEIEVPFMWYVSNADYYCIIFNMKKNIYPQGNQHIPPKRHFWKMFILLKDVFHGWYVTLSAILSSTPSELTVYQAGLAGNHTAFDAKRRWWWAGSLADHCTMWIQMNQQGMRLDSWILIWEVGRSHCTSPISGFHKMTKTICIERILL